MLSTQCLLCYRQLCALRLTKTHISCFFFYTLLSNISRQEITPPAFFLEWKRKCFEMETDQKAAGVALNFSQEKRYCNYKALQVSVLT